MCNGSNTSYAYVVHTLLELWRGAFVKAVWCGDAPSLALIILGRQLRHTMEMQRESFVLSSYREIKSAPPAALH
jgi:hypothetical protein